ncbi:MAG: nucleoside kinase [Firmicutes bacterium]|nr:nucleoside kinase [Bacillota bacterium]
MSDSLVFILPDGSSFSCEPQTPFSQIVAPFQKTGTSPVVAVKLNHEIHDLFFVPESGGNLGLVDLSQEDGVRIYSRSLCFILVRAASELFPGCTVRLEHSLSQGIYGEIYYANQQPLTEKDLRQIAGRMREIIEADEPIRKETIPLDAALEFFKKQGQSDKVRLLKFKKKPEVHLYHCGGYTDYFYGYMVPSTGFLRKFELRFYLPGFILRFPRVSSPAEIPEYHEQRKLARIYYEFEKWGRILEVGDVGALNNQIASGAGAELIRIAEALHEKKVAQIADQIANERERARVILIAGPSSSGKTTFAQRLAVQLRVNGLRPVSISIDNYFVDREKTPKNSNGLPDYECLEAIDLKLFNEQLTMLIQGFPVVLPRYNFQTGLREPGGYETRIAEGQPIIIEGIHGLNDRLTATIPRSKKFKIYISALTQLNIDDHNRIPTTDNRIIRRIVRDNQFRGHDAVRTLELWPMVREGEEKYIFPFQEEADVMFNSALIYELAVLKRYAEPLLMKIPAGVPEYSEAKRLLKFLDYFLPLEDNEVPLNSILREFIGCSCFKER